MPSRHAREQHDLRPLLCHRLVCRRGHHGVDRQGQQHGRLLRLDRLDVGLLLRGVEVGARLGDHLDAELLELVAHPGGDRRGEVRILVPDERGGVVPRPHLRDLARGEPERARRRCRLAVRTVRRAERLRRLDRPVVLATSSVRRSRRRAAQRPRRAQPPRSPPDRVRLLVTPTIMGYCHTPLHVGAAGRRAPTPR